MVRTLEDPGAANAWQSAWERLCLRYRPAMVRYVQSLLRRTGGEAGPEEAEDVVQAFLVACHEKGWLGRADPEYGRFRVFVKVLLARYTRDWIAKRSAKKRDPGAAPLAIDALKSVIGDPGADSPDRLIESAWADCLAGAAVARVKQRSDVNALVLEHTMRAHGVETSELAERFGVSKQQMSMMVLRARRMYAEAVWEEVKETVADPNEREEERAALFGALAPFMDARQAPSFFGRPPA